VISLDTEQLTLDVLAQRMEHQLMAFLDAHG
jgi:hypothetical protein